MTNYVNEVVIRRADIAKALLKQGYSITDIQKDREFSQRTNFVFKNTNDIADAIKAILVKYNLSDDDPKLPRTKFYNKDEHSQTQHTVHGGYDPSTKVVISND